MAPEMAFNLTDIAKVALSNFVDKYKVGVKFLDEIPLVLLGPIGSGKTYSLLSILANRLLVNLCKPCLIVTSSEHRASQLRSIWQENMGEDLQAYPIEFKVFSEVIEPDLLMYQLYIDDAHLIDPVFLYNAMNFDTVYGFNEEHPQTIPTIKALKQKFFDKTQQAIQSLKLSKNIRSSPEVNSLIKKFNHLKISESGSSPKADEATENIRCPLLYLDDKPEFNNQGIIITAQEFVDEAKLSFPNARILTPEEVIENHMDLESLVFYRPLVSNQAISADRVFNIQQSPNSKDNLQDLMFSKRVSEFLRETYSINEQPYRIVKELQKNRPCLRTF
jgi:hypothetical protein